MFSNPPFFYLLSLGAFKTRLRVVIGHVNSHAVIRRSPRFYVTVKVRLHRKAGVG